MTKTQQTILCFGLEGVYFIADRSNWVFKIEPTPSCGGNQLFRLESSSPPLNQPHGIFKAVRQQTQTFHFRFKATRNPLIKRGPQCNLVSRDWVDLSFIYLCINFPVHLLKWRKYISYYKLFLICVLILSDSTNGKEIISDKDNGNCEEGTRPKPLLRESPLAIWKSLSLISMPGNYSWNSFQYDNWRRRGRGRRWWWWENEWREWKTGMKRMKWTIFQRFSRRVKS